MLSRIEVPEDLPALTYLELTRNPLRDLGFLERMTNITYLGLAGCGLTRLALPPSMNQIKDLSLSGNQLRDLSFLTSLPALWRLDLAGNGLKDFRPPTPLPALQELNLSFNRLLGFDFLPLTPGLTTLVANGIWPASRVLRLGAEAAGLRQVNLYESSATNLIIAPGLAGPLRIMLNELGSLRDFVAPESLRDGGLLVGDPPSSRYRVTYYPPQPKLTLDPSGNLTLRAYPAAYGYGIESSADLAEWQEFSSFTNSRVETAVGRVELPAELWGQFFRAVAR